jgi:hypothetical protein
MAWRIKAGQWPNGRVFWTIENPKTRETLGGKGGGVSKYLDKDTAQDVARKMRQTSAQPKAGDVFEVIEP